MTELTLVPPSAQHADQIEAYKQEFLQSGDVMNGTAGLDAAETVAEWIASVPRNLREETVRPGWAPSTTLLGVRCADDRLVGIIDIRHRLNDELLQYHGHIGCSVRPCERRKGYAAEMLRQGLLLCREWGLDRVLVTCDRRNIASAKTILKNGGVLENEVPYQDSLWQRYWVELR